MTKEKFRSKGLHFTTKDLGKMQESLIIDPKKQEMAPASEVSRGLENGKNFNDHVQWAISEGLEKKKGDFYVVVISSYDPIMPTAQRHKYTTTYDCPTPALGTIVFKYTRRGNKLDVLWQLPPPAQTEWLLNRRVMLLTNDNQKKICDYIDQFQDGRLMKLVSELNNEKERNPNVILKVDNDG